MTEEMLDEMGCPKCRFSQFGCHKCDFGCNPPAEYKPKPKPKPAPAQTVKPAAKPAAAGKRKAEVEAPALRRGRGQPAKSAAAAHAKGKGNGKAKAKAKVSQEIEDNDDEVSDDEGDAPSPRRGRGQPLQSSPARPATPPKAKAKAKATEATDEEMDEASDEEEEEEPAPRRRERGRPPKSPLRPEPTRVEFTRNKEPAGRVALKHFMLDDNTKVKVGDAVYVTMNAGDQVDSDEEDELCEVCGLPPDAPGKDAMLECDGCLCGYHLDCLTPKLKRVPDGDWHCPKCVGSVKVGGSCSGSGSLATVQSSAARGGGRGPRTPREKFLAHMFEISRVEAIWREPDGSEMFSGRWYYKPEHTGPGRQPHHGRREVFLSNHVDAQDCASAVLPAKVLSKAAFQAAGDAGDDVYMCEYDYDAGWQRFRRREEGEGEQWSDGDEAGDDDWSEESDDEDEGARAFDPRMEKHRERALQGGTGVRGGKGSTKAKGGKASSRAANGRAGASARRAANFEDAEASGAASCVYGLGASAIPQWVRDRKRSPLQRAKEMLQLATLPPSLPCREKERAVVADFVDGVVSEGGTGSVGLGAGRCLYISGVPGTGKTATVMEVMRAARRQAKAEGRAPFQLVMINGLRLPTPAHAYSAIHEALYGHYVGPAQALESLQARFTPAAGGQWMSGGAKGRKGKGKAGVGEEAPATLLVVDELDSLVTRKQEVLYNLFEWSLSAPRRGVPRLAVIGIANTMDLPERLLPRILSRAGLRRAPFQPYGREQIEAIVRARLDACESAFASDAVDFASRKVAAVSGDVRRALEICRRAAEVAEEREAHSATIPDVRAAVKEMFEGAAVRSIMALSQHERILLVATCVETQRAGVPDVEVATVLRSHAEICRAHSVDPLPPGGHGALMAAIARLGASRLVLHEAGRHARAKVGLNVSIADLGLASRADESMSWLATLVK